MNRPQEKTTLKQNSLNGNIEALLLKLQACDAELKQLQDQRYQIREELKSCLKQEGQDFCDVKVSGQDFNLRVKRRQVVDYKEDELRQRLGDERYREILAPDINKIKKQLDKLDGALAAHLDQIGSPSPALVHKAVKKGLMTYKEFAGLFSKETKETLYVCQGKHIPWKDRQARKR